MKPLTKAEQDELSALFFRKNLTAQQLERMKELMKDSNLLAGALSFHAMVKQK